MENVKTDLSNIDFIIPVRIDNDERLSNIEIQQQFFNNTAVNHNFIYVEDDVSSKFQSAKFIRNYGLFNKSRCYNEGIKLSTRKYICLLDSDVLINPTYILQSINRQGICIGYNRKCIYLTYQAKHYIQQSPQLDTLYRLIPSNCIVNGKFNFPKLDKKFIQYEFFMLPPNDCIGGCLVADKETLYNIGGFNETFCGWGYEDNEILTRANKLNQRVVYLQDENAILYHLPHEDSIISTQRYSSSQNKQEMDKIDNITSDELSEYIRSLNFLQRE